MNKILIVEDDFDILSIIEEKLTILGFQIQCCTGEEDMTDIVEKFRPDIILLDIMLPNKDGIQIAQEIKANPELQSIPLIAVSGNPDIGDTQHYLNAGFIDTCPKPINYTDLIMKIARHLNLDTT